jgi:hypothetical protein
VVAILGWMYWSDVVSRQSTDDWATFHRKVELAWKVIPIAMAVSIASGVASLAVKPRTRSATIISLGALGAALVVAGLMWFITTGMAIQ